MFRLSVQLLAIVVLGFLLVDAGKDLWRTLTGEPSAARVVSTPPSPANRGADQPALDFKPRPLSDYTETVTRPVFFEGRTYPAPVKPPEPPKPVAAPPRPPVRITADGLKLRGVIISGSTARALIAVGDAPAAWLTVGQSVQAWTIQAIRQTSVRLTGNNGTQFATLSLYEEAGE